MTYGALADIIVLIHTLFVLFVVFGGFAVLRWGKLLRVHLPAVAWGIAIELFDWECPLTPLENHLRYLGGRSGYSGGFIETYLEPVLYPLGLTQHTRILFGSAVFLINVIIYTTYWRRAKNTQKD